MNELLNNPDFVNGLYALAGVVVGLIIPKLKAWALKSTNTYDDKLVEFIEKTVTEALAAKKKK